MLGLSRAFGGMPHKDPLNQLEVRHMELARRHAQLEHNVHGVGGDGVDDDVVIAAAAAAAGSVAGLDQAVLATGGNSDKYVVLIW